MNPSEQSTKDFILIYNDRNTYPTLIDVAEKLGITVKTVVNKAAQYRNITKKNPNIPKIITRTRKQTSPMSEDNSRYMEDWTEDDCIAELQRVASQDTDKVISRNYFRIHSSISEATWNRYFGTFLEFKRQAGIVLSRQAHKLERDIAKHASTDIYKSVEKTRKDYSGKFLRENKSRFKTALVATDVHDKDVDPFYLRVFVDTAERAQPDKIIFGGDFFDLPEFSKYTQDPRTWDVVGRIKYGHSILEQIREVCPDTEIIMIEGNHEHRLLRLLSESTPALKAVLSDLHDMSVAKLLGLDTYEVNYLARCDLKAFTERDIKKELGKNYYILWESALIHHFPYAKSWGMPGINGHHHQHKVWSEFHAQNGPYEWHQLGAGHRRSAEYTEGERWNNGFAMINVDTEKRKAAFDYVSVMDFAISGGQWYYRTEEEQLMG